MGDIERRKRPRKHGDLSNPALIEINHTFGSVRKSVYNVLEQDEYGMSFLMPEADGYFPPGLPLEYSMMNSGQSKVESFGLVKYYRFLYDNSGEAFFKVGLENKTDKGPEPANIKIRHEQYNPEAHREVQSIRFSIHGNEHSFPLEAVSSYSAAFYCSEEMILDLALAVSRIVEPVVISLAGRKIYEGAAIVIRRSFDQGRHRIVIAPRNAVFNVDVSKERPTLASVAQLAKSLVGAKKMQV